jgi:hypothetical protein
VWEADSAAQGIEPQAASKETSVTESGKWTNLLKPTQDERIHGPAVYDASQPMIKKSTSAAAGGSSDSDIRDALRRFSKFIFNLVRGSLETANMQTIAMPWIMPGFNVWVDPVVLDKIYYVTNVTHMGAKMRAFTNLTMIMGRSTTEFLSNNSNVIGARDVDGSTFFFNTINKKVSDFGEIPKSEKEYLDLRQKISSIYNGDKYDFDIISAMGGSHLNDLYGKPDVVNLQESTTSTTSSQVAKKVDFNLSKVTMTLRRKMSQRDKAVRDQIKELQKALR